MIPGDFPNKTVYDSMHFLSTFHDTRYCPKSLRVLKFWHEMAYLEQIISFANIYITIEIFFSCIFTANQVISNDPIL